MLDISTFTPQRGGNVFYKAIAHPLAASRIEKLASDLGGDARLAVYDPDHEASNFFALYPAFQPTYGFFTHRSEEVGKDDGRGGVMQPVVEIAQSDATHILALSFDDAKTRSRLSRVTRGDQQIITLGGARLPEAMLSNKRNYLDKLNFATNFAFFRDDDQLSTRLVAANYWGHYGATNVRYWSRLYDGVGRVIAEWEEHIGSPGAGIIIDSQDVRKRFALPAFCGQLFLHILGARGHDTVKYALDIYGRGRDASLSVTHDANAWPSPRFATLPAPDDDEQIILWVQNSHASPISVGEITLNRMGETREYPVTVEIPAFGTYRLDVGELMPDVKWPVQLELRAGNHIVRPRYEVVQRGLTRIAHLNIERQDLKPDPTIAKMPSWMGRGFIMPFPVLDPARYTTFLQPNPMSEEVTHLPVRVDLFDRQGRQVGQEFLGNLPRHHAAAFAMHDLTPHEGHGELVYDFRDGGAADGWLHAMLRYRDRTNGHAAETSFGAHIFNTLMTWRNEPQSYTGPPPGLTTRLFLKLGQAGMRSFSHLIYPTSLEGGTPSETILHLMARDGTEIAQEAIHIAPSGSAIIWPDEIFGSELIGKAGEGGYVLIRDMTCRLFGYHGQMNGKAGFSLDHMFGF
ncbi:hypothetical protein N5W20_03095 [Candidatus Kirkpatrickella diaphorinae]|uniref:Uncharacterized protein n=1 Tax=Candidatus Kirkpatrickella diaphorinae TaxID=2984322 RepID=A0ABY6GLF7_9PROT|nr:hypothetical protein [Candidatus Kirkpatrickella diaphorinae]UYH51861.1 hypothetical protein N5W20_03095 [Candidatus Kirkpatrickella diaphorinae]